MTFLLFVAHKCGARLAQFVAMAQAAQKLALVLDGNDSPVCARTLGSAVGVPGCIPQKSAALTLAHRGKSART